MTNESKGSKAPSLGGFSAILFCSVLRGEGLGLVLGLEIGLGVGMGRGVGLELRGVELEEEPKTLPWPLNLPEDEEEKELLTFFMNPFILSFMSPIAEKRNSVDRSEFGTEWKVVA